MVQNRKILIVAISLLIALSVMTLGVFAYFKIINSENRGFDTASDGTVVEISSFYELYAFSKSEGYNSASSTSELRDRKTLVFTGDITLSSNVFITADCHIDLNGNSLYLNGKTLTFTHGYSGSTVVSDGKIYPYSEAFEDNMGNQNPEVLGKIVFDLPNSEVVLDSLELCDNQGVQISPDVAVKTLWQTSGDLGDEKYAVYNALYTVADSLVDEYDSRPERLTYDEVQSLERLDMSSVLFTKRSCGIKNSSEICVFACRDINLPQSYNGLDVTIEYSTNSSCLSASGKLNATDGINDVTLGITATCGATELSDSVNVHVFSTDDHTATREVAKAAILSHLEPYYNSDTGIYELNRGIFLPISFEHVKYEYVLYYDAEGTKPVDDAVSEVSSHFVNVEPTVDSHLFEIKIIESDLEYETVTLPMVSGNTGVIVTNASTAKNIVESWYNNGKITISPTSVGDNYQVTAYSTQDLRLDVDQFTDRYGIIGVEYELMNDPYGVYEIVDAEHVDFGDIKRLKVVSGKHPGDYVLDVFVNCKFTFIDKNGVESEEQIQIPVEYDSTMQGDNVNEFLPYYTYYNELLYANYAGATYRDFEIPFCYGNYGPIVCYDVVIFSDEDNYVRECPEFLTIALYYNGEERVAFDYDGKTDGKDRIRELLDAYLEANSISLQTIIDYGDAKWIFKLDSSKMPSSNTALGLIYNYKMSTESSDWTTYPNPENPEFSRITVLGIIHLGTDVESEALYAWIFNKFNISNQKYTSYYSGDLVVSDWLKQNIAVDVVNDDSFPKDENLSFKGLEFLVGTKYVDLSGHPALKNAANADNADKAVLALAGMTALETLKISDCAFRDRTDAVAPDNNTVSKLTELPNLRYLYVNGNSIYSFEWLNNIMTLEQVFVYDNVTINFESVFYGSEGLVNLQVFKDLTDRGVLVYNKKNGDNILLYEENNDVNDYVRLSSIEYQRKLKVGLDIRELYSNLSTVPSDYALSSSYTYSNSQGTSQTVNSVMHRLSFGYIGDDPGTAEEMILVDSIKAGTTTVNITIKFRVVRFE